MPSLDPASWRTLIALVGTWDALDMLVPDRNELLDMDPEETRGSATQLPTCASGGLPTGAQPLQLGTPRVACCTNPGSSIPLSEALTPFVDTASAQAAADSISPDGRSLAYLHQDQPGGPNRVTLKRLDLVWIAGAAAGEALVHARGRQ